MAKLRWGIIGTGRIANLFAAGVHRSQTGELVAVASRFKSKARDFAKEYEIPHAHGSYEALVADPKVDIVYIATPHAQHREWALRAAEAKKHVLCEKPIGLHHDEAVAMIQAAWENSVFFMEAYMYRCHPQIARTIELIRAGTIGDVRFDKFDASRNSFSLGVAEVVDHGDLMPLLHEQRRSGPADVAGSAGNENLHEKFPPSGNELM